MLCNVSNKIKDLYCRLKLPVRSICRKCIGYLFAFCEQKGILLIWYDRFYRLCILQVIIGRYKSDAITKRKGEREILVTPNFLLNLNPLTNPS